MTTDLTRRDFVLTSSAALAALPLTGVALGASRREEILEVGVIGCGGRGTGAATDALNAGDNVKVTALADVFPDRVQSARSHLASMGERGVVPDDRCFSGFDAYQKLLKTGVHIVILATPPHFRPFHFEAAIAAGKHVFMEKPVAVDPAGVRRVIAAARVAQSKRLCVVAGTQRRHESSYLAAMEHVQGGGLGEVVAARCYWNQGGLWVNEQQPSWSGMEWQLRNWLYFTWLSGDHIVEQHIHNIDVVNWAFGAMPVKCVALGGRQARTEAKFGHIFDHFAVEFEYPGNRFALSMCRQQDGTASRVEEVIHGSMGKLVTRPGFAQVDGAKAWRWSGKNNNPYVQEHVDLQRAIRADDPVNEGERVAHSTLCAIMGRMAAYTGQEVSWQQALESPLDLTPASYEFGDLPVPPVAIPGRTKLV